MYENVVIEILSSQSNILKGKFRGSKILTLRTFNFSVRTCPDSEEILSVGING